MSQHTPGPWVQGNDWIDDNCVYGNDKLLIASVEHDKHIEANVDLIVAAPDLLKAAEMVLLAEQGMNVPPKAAAMTFQAKAWHKLWLVAKKAGGEA